MINEQPAELNAWRDQSGIVDSEHHGMKMQMENVLPKSVKCIHGWGMEELKNGSYTITSLSDPNVCAFTTRSRKNVQANPVMLLQH